VIQRGCYSKSLTSIETEISVVVNLHLCVSKRNATVAGVVVNLFWRYDTGVSLYVVETIGLEELRDNDIKWYNFKGWLKCKKNMSVLKNSAQVVNGGHVVSRCKYRVPITQRSSRFTLHIWPLGILSGGKLDPMQLIWTLYNA